MNFILVWMCLVFGFIGFYFGYKRGNKDLTNSLIFDMSMNELRKRHAYIVKTHKEHMRMFDAPK